MRIGHHLMMPRPPRPEHDAVYQEARFLADRLGGEVDFLYPARRYHRWLPRRLYGMTQTAHLEELDKRVDAHQVYSNGLFVYPALDGLRKPVVYCLTTPLGRRPQPGAMAGARAWVTPIERDADSLRRAGAGRVEVLRPGIELGRFSDCAPPPPLTDGLTLMAGSAPWTPRQFRTKGLTALLDTAVSRPELRLILLWRGAHVRRLRASVARRRLADRVEILDRPVAVEEVLGRSHAAVVLSASAQLVKAYPHSLLEALAAGRPVLLSPVIELARTVRACGAGELVPELSSAALTAAVDRLRAGYLERQRAAAAMDLAEFSRARLLERYRALYHELAAPRVTV